MRFGGLDFSSQDLGGLDFKSGEILDESPLECTKYKLLKSKIDGMASNSQFWTDVYSYKQCSRKSSFRGNLLKNMSLAIP